jgi:hypothetical protein
MSPTQAIPAAHRTLHWFVLLFMAATSAANGVLMILFSEQWYLCLITPERAALFNPHFVIDVGSAYVTVGVALLWAALRPAYAFPLVTMGLLFSLLHAGNHLYEYLSFGNPTRYIAIELLGIWGPVVVLGWLSRALKPRGALPQRLEDERLL